MFERIDRRRVKAETRDILRNAQVSPRSFFALYLGITALMNLCSSLTSLAGDSFEFLSGPAGLFVSIFTSLLTPILGIGAYLYCMTIRRGERAEYLTLFDGFSFAGKIIVLFLLQTVYIFLWTLLFIIPGFVAAYRYRFAYLNLCENPSLTPAEALNLSKQQTQGYKVQLLQLDLSYIGWILLASLPMLALSALVTDPELFNSIALNPLYTAAELGCSFGFGLIYMPSYYTSELAYFETAVRTSGLTPESPRPREDDPFF
jgi:uncharacterized membrane protein